MAKDDNYPPSPTKVDLEYYLGSSDHPDLVITPIKLRRLNYNEWAKALRRSLIAKWKFGLKKKWKFGFIHRSITEPTSDATKIKNWVAMRSVLVYCITNTLGDDVWSQINDFDIASDLCMHLKKRYCVELVQYACVLKCSFGGCKCNIAKQVADICDTDYAIHAQLLAQTPLPSFDEAYQTVCNT
ncbi:putative GTP-binding protein EngB [Bienertia sinuspersici]